MDLKLLLELDRRAKATGEAQGKRRDLYETVVAETGRHFIGITGPRGAGKTILLQQLAAGAADSCYISLDTLPTDTDLYELLETLCERYGYHRFYLDEIHFIRDSLGALKKIYDFLEVRVIFTSSVALQIRESAHDLARRVRLHSLDYFSFREYLDFKHGERFSRLSLNDLLGVAIPPRYLRVADRLEAYLRGGLMPFALEEPEPLPLLEATIEKIIFRDIPRTLRLHLDELDTLRRMLAFIGRSGVDGINYTNLSANLKITKYKAEQYVCALEKAYILQQLFPLGTNVMREPKVLLMPPIRCLYRPFEEARGGLREDFVALAFRQAQLPLAYLKGTRGQKTPDFRVQHQGQNIVFEVGGKRKGRTQFKGVVADRKVILAEDAGPTAGRLPLHLIGFLA